ncbi:MAG: imidazole glycerol phosphate synthase subunit HisH [Rhodobacteraceae bacterium]|nr:imidazole glycerol phosphate synthase subunit HisH [Paracoccaceae bacterium]
MRIVIIDYDTSGNLHSAEKAFRRMAAAHGGGQVVVSPHAEDVARADRLVLPGDGAFPACAAALRARDGLHEALEQAVVHGGRPFLGICVGMQLMASCGHEYTQTRGLDWIGGHVRRIPARDPALKVPHMGWNDLVIEHPHPVLEGIKTGDHVYFVHSYHFQVDHPTHRLAYAEYGQAITAIIGRDTMVGLQFHPEKSQHVGLRMIGNFLRWCP